MKLVHDFGRKNLKVGTRNLGVDLARASLAKGISALFRIKLSTAYQVSDLRQFKATSFSNV